MHEHEHDHNKQINDNSYSINFTNASSEFWVFRGIVAPGCHVAISGRVRRRNRNGAMTWRRDHERIGGGRIWSEETNAADFGVADCSRDTWCIHEDVFQLTKNSGSVIIKRGELGFVFIRKIGRIFQFQE